MPTVNWNSSFLLGIKDIDDHHQHLVKLLNLAQEEFKKGAPVGNLPYYINQLIDYANYHFTCEERWMADTSYPDLIRHKEEHKVFICKVYAFQKSFRQNEESPAEMLSFIGNWVTHHILDTDAKFGNFLALKKVSRKTMAGLFH